MWYHCHTTIATLLSGNTNNIPNSCELSFNSFKFSLTDK